MDLAVGSRQTVLHQGWSCGGMPCECYGRGGSYPNCGCAGTGSGRFTRGSGLRGQLWSRGTLPGGRLACGASAARASTESGLPLHLLLTLLKAVPSRYLANLLSRGKRLCPPPHYSQRVCARFPCGLSAWKMAERGCAQLGVRRRGHAAYEEQAPRNSSSTSMAIQTCRLFTTFHPMLKLPRWESKFVAPLAPSAAAHQLLVKPARAACHQRQSQPGAPVKGGPAAVHRNLFCRGFCKPTSGIHCYLHSRTLCLLVPAGLFGHSLCSFQQTQFSVEQAYFESHSD